MITYELLESRGACENQVKLFRNIFPEGVEVSVELCVKYASEFDFNWAGGNLLKDTKAYKEAEEPLWEVYKESEEHLWKAYKEVEEPLLRSYKEVKEPLWKAYKEGLAKVFAELYLRENNYD